MYLCRQSSVRIWEVFRFHSTDTWKNKFIYILYGIKFQPLWSFTARQYTRIMIIFIILLLLLRCRLLTLPFSFLLNKKTSLTPIQFRKMPYLIGRRPTSVINVITHVSRDTHLVKVTLLWKSAIWWHFNGNFP